MHGTTVFPPHKSRRGPLLFLPGRWQRPALLKWLKRVHAWTGLWGAALFLMLGVSGVLLNHRSVLPIETGEPEVSTVALPVEAGAIVDADALGRWAKRTLSLPADPKLPKGEAPDRVRFADRTVAPAAQWSRSFTLPNQKITVTYVAGSAAVTAKTEAVGALGLLKNLHKGTGLPIAWVLLLDTIAGALVAMSLTGVLLWSRLHGSRLLAAALAGGSLSWALAASVPQLG